MRTLATVCLLGLVLFANGQEGNCRLTVSGVVVDRSTGSPLAYANIYIEESRGGAASDSSGSFSIDRLCPGDYHFRVSHLGCETERLFFRIKRDTVIIIELHHHSELLDELIIHGHAEDRSIQVSAALDADQVAELGQKNLSGILETFTGVRSLKTGSRIGKPVIHGLFGNRIIILNDGLVQAGQQWGNGHAPEIDPFVADHLSVVKGASALTHAGNALGGVVLVEPGHINEDPHLHGAAHYRFQSNGVGQVLNARLEKYSNWAAWRVTGTMKFSGDNRSANYYLTNTGERQFNISAQLDKNFKGPWMIHNYYSLFHSEVGILRGAHIGNTTDLELALERNEPFFTQDHFSYGIEAPSHNVSHHLITSSATFSPDNNMALNFRYGGQWNDRKEFDVRRSGRSDIPAMSLQQQTHSFDANLTLQSDKIQIKPGLQYAFQSNKNNPETGILPLIPDYRSNEIGTFLVVSRDWPRVYVEAGGRYDYRRLHAITISNTTPREIVIFDTNDHGYAFSGGLNIKAHERLKIILEGGYALRAPEVNERYSSGLHQGVSGIEEGDNTLNSERSFKSILSLEWNVRDRLFIEALGYVQHIDEYIFLEPQDEIRLTIRGAFPVFLYQQTDAFISGTDILLSTQPADPLKLIFKYSLVRGRNISENLPLINMPSDRVSTEITYAFPDKDRWKETQLSVDGTYVFEQKKLEEDQDFAAPPEGYFLLGLDFQTEVQLGKYRLGLHLSIDNLLNKAYRDYLNRQRYFADDLGIDVGLGINFKF